MSRNDRTRKTPLINFGDDEAQNTDLNDLLGLSSVEPSVPVKESYVEPAAPEISDTRAGYRAHEKRMPEPEMLVRYEEKPVESLAEDRSQKVAMPNTVYKMPEPPVQKDTMSREPVHKSFFDEAPVKQERFVAEPVSVQVRGIRVGDGAVVEPYEQVKHYEDPKPVRKERIDIIDSDLDQKKDVQIDCVPRPREEQVMSREFVQKRQEPPMHQRQARPDQEIQYMPHHVQERESFGQEPPMNADGLSNGVGGVTFAQQLRGYEYAKVAPQEAQHRTYKNQIITVYSPKGGVGKSTIAKEIALALSSEGPNKETYRVLLIDSDWEYGDVATLFNVRNYPNMTGLVKSMRRERTETGRISIRSSQELEQYLIPYRAGGIKNLDLLVSSGNATDHTLIDEYVVRAMIENYRTLNYDFIIFDNANSIQGRTLLPLMVADFMVLVETLDSTTIFETRSLLQTLRSKQFDFNKIRMVFNKVPQDRKNLDITTADVENLFKLKTVAAIPSEEDAARLLNNACESFILGKESAVSREIKKIVNSITPCYKEPKKGFFARLFNKK